MKNIFYIVMSLLVVISMLALSGCEQKHEIIESPVVTQPDDESFLEKEEMVEEQNDQK